MDIDNSLCGESWKFKGSDDEDHMEEVSGIIKDKGEGMAEETDIKEEIKVDEESEEFIAEDIDNSLCGESWKFEGSDDKDHMEEVPGIIKDEGEGMAEETDIKEEIEVDEESEEFIAEDIDNSLCGENWKFEGSDDEDHMEEVPGIIKDEGEDMAEETDIKEEIKVDEESEEFIAECEETDGSDNLKRKECKGNPSTKKYNPPYAFTQAFMSQSSNENVCKEDKTMFNKNDNNTSDDSSKIHLTDRYICNNCGNIFGDKCLLKEHIEHHVGVEKKNNGTTREESLDNLYTISQSFIKTDNVNEQEETQTYLVKLKHTDKKIFKCDVCDRRFSRKGYLNAHLVKHNRKKNLNCDICHRKFNKTNDLTKHYRIHTGEKRFKCDICHRRFSRSDVLKTHLKIHTGEKNFACEICSQRFTRKIYLDYHLRTHTGEKNFECEFCQQRFYRKVQLNAHLIIHTGNKSFQCDICDRRFVKKSCLSSHLVTHTDKKSYKCDVCNQSFNRKCILTNHLATHSEGKFQCEICHRRFNRKTLLNNHLLTHTGEKNYVCEICSRRYYAKPSLTAHLTTHRNKSFKCEICHQTFSRKKGLNSHLAIHTGDRNFECNICHERFIRKAHLNSHLLLHTETETLNVTFVNEHLIERIT